MDVLDQLEKLMKSAELFKLNYENGEKRLAVGDLDYLRDRCVKLTYLVLAEIEEENLNNRSETNGK